MGRVKFSKENDKENTAKAMAYELHISPKHSFEICNAIKGMKVEDAERYLEEVIEKRKAVPFKRYKRKVAHRKGLKKWYAGRYPKNATFDILKLIRDARINAEYKGLETEAMKILHIATKKGRTIRGIIPRAFRRATAKNTETVTIEIVLGEGVV